MARQTARKNIPSVRPDPVRVSVYNEGLCVYVWDEGHTGRLRDMISGGECGASSPRKSFFDNLSVSRFAKTVRDEGLALAYTLEQDDEVEVEIAVGEPLTAQELSLGSWLEPQCAMLALPTGRLRIDTSNTMPLDPDEKTDPGALVEVAAGHYLVSLYRIDGRALGQNEQRSKGPQEFIVLTRADTAPKRRSGGPILKYAQPSQSPSAKATGTRRQDGGFECEINFGSYWEQFFVSLTRSASTALRLTPGARLRFHVEKFSLEGLYLGDMTPADFQRFSEKERLEAALSAWPEFAVSEWAKRDGEECLLFRRIKATRCVPDRMLGKWAAAAGFVLPERLEAPRSPAVAPPDVCDGAIRCSVTFSAPAEVVLNVQAGHLEAISAKPGDLLRLESEGQPRRSLAYGASVMSRNQHTVVTGELPPSYEATYARLIELKLPNRFFTLKGSGRNSAYRGALPVLHLGDCDAWPVVGVIAPPVEGAGAPTLRLTPFSHNGNSAPEPWSEGLKAGAKVVIRAR